MLRLETMGDADAGGDGDGDDAQLQPPPEYIDQRIQLFERLRAEYDAFVQGVSPLVVLFVPSLCSLCALC